MLTTKGHGKGMDMYIDGKLEATHPRGLNCEQEAGGCIGLNKGNSDLVSPSNSRSRGIRAGKNGNIQ